MPGRRIVAHMSIAATSGAGPMTAEQLADLPRLADDHEDPVRVTRGGAHVPRDPVQPGDVQRAETAQYPIAVRCVHDDRGVLQMPFRVAREDREREDRRAGGFGFVLMFFTSETRMHCDDLQAALPSLIQKARVPNKNAFATSPCSSSGASLFAFVS